MEPGNIEAHVFKSPLFEGIVNDAIKFFTSTPILDLPPTIIFNGVGVYALYYFGDYEPYERIVEKNKKKLNLPIYVGKAVPEGWRTARVRIPDSPVLFRRLNEHARSIQQCNNLEREEFRCRFIILNEPESDLVVPIEAELIRRFKPLWNNAIDGFGNHDPGSGRYNQAKSEWDILHPGRPWAERLTGKSPSIDEILANVIGALREL
jgi:hypothetical protein